jgi:hypothetical protein
MNRFPVLLALAGALAVVLGLGACGDVHLGTGYGLRVRAALDAQAEPAGGRQGPVVGPLDADDARTTMARQHGARSLGPGQLGPAPLGAPLSAGGSAGAGGVALPPPIRLESR